MYHYLGYHPAFFQSQGLASGFVINNPGGPVSLNPQPLPPKIYFGGLGAPMFLNPQIQSAILAR